jgi:hypothetical protein
MEIPLMLKVLLKLFFYPGMLTASDSYELKQDRQSTVPISEDVRSSRDSISLCMTPFHFESEVFLPSLTRVLIQQRA